MKCERSITRCWQLTGGIPYPGWSEARTIAELQKGYRMPKPSHVDSSLWVSLHNWLRVSARPSGYGCTREVAKHEGIGRVAWSDSRVRLHLLESYRRIIIHCFRKLVIFGASKSAYVLSKAWFNQFSYIVAHMWNSLTTSTKSARYVQQFRSLIKKCKIQYMTM